MSYTKKPKTINPDEVDPSVYYYDEVYDDMKDQESSHRGTQESTKKEKQGSKYIQGIIETADRRKSEKEIRKFKKYARDREEAEAQGELEGTDVYVSRSYEKKLKEMQDALKKQVTPDKNLELNSFKRHKRDTDEKLPDVRTKQPIASKTDGDIIEDGATTLATSREPEISKRTRPKTLDERREYLRDVLKKQTVGELFDAAVRRFRQRKAAASTSSC